jgi:hypothetical protein
MKTIAIAVVVSAAALAASSARADTRVRIGVNIGSPEYYPPASVVVAAPAPAVVYAPAPQVVYAPAPTVVVAPRGYWQEVQVKTWVPERWVVRTSRWGRAERYCEPGYYTYRTDRVWVENHPVHGRGNAYAYGRDHRGYDHRGYSYSDNRGWNR